MLDEAVSPRWTAETAWSLAASFLLHALLAVAIVSVWSAALPPVPIEEVIPVNLLIDAEPEARSPPAPPSATTARPAPPAAAAPGADEAMTQATTILSGRALAEPRNREARDALPHLAPTERMVQLCNIEALAQIAEARPEIAPETISAYATKGLAIGPDTVEADGAAVRSGDDWRALRYRCRLSPGHGAVLAFAFRVGDRLTPDRIAELGLPVGK